MKNGNIIVNIIFGVAIVILFVLYVQKPSVEKKKSNVQDTVAVLDTIFNDEPMVEANFPIAYVVVDSVMQNYLFFKKLEKQLQNLVSAEESKLQKKAEAFQKDVQDFQYQVENRIITTADAQAKQAELEQRQQNLYAEQQKKQQELAIKEQKLQEQLIDSVNACIKFYNADGKYKIILNNAYQSSVLYAEEQLNITNDILKVMNARYNASQPAQAKK
ncbi:MAG: OmpH family outer membrane protein [Bacteroidales bacterium]|nr:OmpH family outer membrane protein [Bacteroidales bacterium]